MDLGHEVDIYAGALVNSSLRHPVVQKYDLLNRTRFQEMPQSKAVRLVRAFGLFGSNLRNARLLARSLDFSRYGRYAYTLRLLYRAVPFLESEHYDVVHCHFGPQGNAGVALREIGVVDCKIITTFYGVDVSQYVRERGRGYYEDLFDKGDFFLAISEHIAGQIVDFGCPRSKVAVLPLGVDLSKYEYQPSRLGSPKQSVKLLTVARLVEKKGLVYSIAALGQVIDRNPNILYRIVGDGPLRSSLEELVEDMGLINNVRFLGWKTQEEVRKLYSDSHIFVLPSVTSSDGDQEGQGLVLQEAQATGLPVLATLHNGFPEGVLDGKSGFLVPERDVDALASRLRFLLENPELWSRMGRAGRKYVEENYDIDKLNMKLARVYQEVLLEGST
jgi:colanic acid/amylovoran biosynthesis glycosyltransferase